MILREKRIPKDILEKFKRKSGDDFISQEGEFVCNEHGFAVFEINKRERELVIIQCFGDGRYWEDFFKGLAKKEKCKKIIFFSKRKPNAWIKRFNGLRIKGYLLEYEIDG